MTTGTNSRGTGQRKLRFLDNGTVWTSSFIPLSGIGENTTAAGKTVVIATVQRTDVSHFLPIRNADTCTVCTFVNHWRCHAVFPEQALAVVFWWFGVQKNLRTGSVHNIRKNGIGTYPKGLPWVKCRTLTNWAGGRTAAFNMVLSVSEKNLRWLNRGPGKKICTYAIAPSSSWWFILTQSRQTVNVAGNSTEPLTTNDVNWKTWDHKKKYEILSTLRNTKANTSSLFVVKAETGLATAKRDWSTFAATLLQLLLLAHKRVEFGLCSFKLTASDPTKTKNSV